MARTPSTEDVYEGDGATSVFQFHFPFLHESDVFVSVDGVNVTFTLLPGSIAQVQTTVPPAAGTVVKVYRNTEAFVPEHLFAGGVPFLPRYVDENNRQLLYATQEAINDTAVTAAEALVTAEEAKQIAQDAEDKVDGAIFDSSYQLRLDLANGSDPAKGGALVEFARNPLAQSIKDVNTMISGLPVNVWEYAHLCGGYVSGGNPALWDWRPAFQAAFNAWACVYVPATAAPYRIVGEVALNSYNSLVADPAVRIQQIMPNTTTFKVILKDHVWFILNGAMILGEGSWSNTWTGMGGHDDRAIQLWGCKNSGAIRPHIRNCASAGVAIFGGADILIDHPTIEGTHLYGHPLQREDNFQVCVYIRDEATYGICDNLRIPGANLSGAAHGVLSELYMASSLISRAHSIPNAVIHDIPGQHAFYTQGGALNCDGAVITNTALAGFKVQAGDAGAALRSFSALGVTANGIGSNLFELNDTAAGSVNGVILSGTVDGCDSGLAINNEIRDVKAKIVVTNARANPLLIQGDGAKDIDVDLTAQTCGDEGVLITATNATGIRVKALIREPNQNNGAGKAGILVQSPSAHVVLDHPVITDSTGKMDWGLFHSTLGGTVKVRGSANITGARDTAVRAIGKIVEWPQESNLSGNNGEFIGLANVTSSGPMRTRAVSNSTTNVVVWQRALVAGKTVTLHIKLTATNSSNTERRSVELFASAYLNGGVATILGAVTTVANAQSAGFTGGFILQGTGGDMVLLANSGGVATYNWTATVDVTEA